jgi:uncharacterized protein YecE (DUF72 family)
MNSSWEDCEVHVGVSGWRYPEWRNVFYPRGLKQRQELAYASRAVRTIEINGSFYSLQRPSSYVSWYEATPADFTFAVKGGRFITHNKKLHDCEAPLGNFFASGVLALEDKLGPILWQLPPQLSFNRDRVTRFLDLLPRSTDEAARFARKHRDGRLTKTETYLDVCGDWPIRYAIEPRHESFHDDAFLDLLRERHIAVCIADTAGKWPYIEELTADFAYVRLHGSKRLYASGYSSVELNEWALRIHRWQAMGKDDVYVYFDNTVKVRAPFDAINLASRFDCAVEEEPLPLPHQTRKSA